MVISMADTPKTPPPIGARIVVRKLITADPHLRVGDVGTVTYINHRRDGHPAAVCVDWDHRRTDAALLFDGDDWELVEAS
jgi:hypothetical protein